jgi:hypothetical protein
VAILGEVIQIRVEGADWLRFANGQDQIKAASTRAAGSRFRKIQLMRVYGNMLAIVASMFCGLTFARE